MFKIKTFLPQIKQAEVKKNGQQLEEWLFEENPIIFPGIEGLDFN